MTAGADAADLELATSPDGQWTIARDGRQLALFAGGGGAAVGKIELPTTDVDVALVGPPTVLVVLARESHGNQIVLYTTPYLEAAARLDLDTSARIAAVTGPRLAVVAADGKHVAIVRSAGRALATQKIEVAGPVEFAVGLERTSSCSASRASSRSGMPSPAALCCARSSSCRHRRASSARVPATCGRRPPVRDSRSDAEIETALVSQLGRIAMIEGSLPRALLEARLHGATAVALGVPPERPRPWPRDAGLVLVLYGTNASWVADLPALTPPATA